MRGMVEVVQLGLKLWVEGKPAVSVDLNRIQAQQIAEALLEYSGAKQKSIGRSWRTIVSAFGDDVPQRPEPIVRLSGSRKKSRVVRL